jgi:hypothetical protein
MAYDCLWVLSGGCDLNVLLDFLLQQRRMKSTVDKVTGTIHPKLNHLMNTIKEAHGRSEGHNQKRQLLSLVTESHNFNGIKSVGFQVSRRNFIVAKRHCIASGPGQPVPQTTTTKMKGYHDHCSHFGSMSSFLTTPMNPPIG